MGSLQSITSVGIIVMPVAGTVILGLTSRLPQQDWRVGTTFFACALLQAFAITLALRYFKGHRVKG